MRCSSHAEGFVSVPDSLKVGAAFSQTEGSLCMMFVIMLCGGTLGELTKRWLIVLGYVSGTSNDHGKAKACPYTSSCYDL